MSETITPKFTPGPWGVSGESIVTDNHCIAVIEDDGGYQAPWDEQKVNARLIAAAPDLYQSLRSILAWVNHSCANCEDGCPFANAHALLEQIDGGAE